MPTAWFSAARADLCLEFADTLCWRGSEPPTEGLKAPEDLLAWCRESGGVDAAWSRQIERQWRARPAVGARGLAEAIELREALYRSFAAIAAGREPAPADLARFNRALGDAPARRQLGRAEGAFRWKLDEPQPSVAALLAPVLWSAADLMAGPRLERVRQCANEKCRWLFLDDSKSGTRRWCMMSMCGNRAKAHRHYLRQKAANG